MESSPTCQKKGDTIIEPCDHHAQAEFCTTRAAYRQGKELKAVKVYTINDESQHLLYHNVPAIGLLKELKKLASRHGRIEVIEQLHNYPSATEFAHVYYVKYSKLWDARQAKKKLDNRSFFGNLLHICYAPELESPEECRSKLKGRLNSIQQVRKPFPAKKIKGERVVHLKERGAPSFGEGTWSNLIPASSSKLIPKDSCLNKT